MFMALVEGDLHAQRVGMVEVIYQPGRCGLGVDVMWNMQALRSVLPVRAAAIHVCTEDPAIKMIAKIMRPLLSAHMLSRIRIHSSAFHVQFMHCMVRC